MVGYLLLLAHVGRFTKPPLVFRFIPDHICSVSGNTETQPYARNVILKITPHFKTFNCGKIHITQSLHLTLLSVQ